MKRLADSDYYSARLTAEVEAAARESDQHVRRVHEAFAEAYRRRLAECRDSAVAQAPHHASVAPISSAQPRASAR